jgi:hypothetical protein
MINLRTKSWFDFLKIGFLAIVLGIGTGYVLAVDWTPPPGPGPGCDDSIAACNPPINVSATDQIKEGGIGAFKLTADFGGISNTLFVGFIGDDAAHIDKSNGTIYYYNDAFKPNVGDVLTAADTSGKVVWGAGGGLSGLYVKRAPMDADRTSTTQVESCTNNTSESHPCDFIDCKPNDAGTGICKYKTITGKSVKQVDLYCNQTNGQYDMAISGSAVDQQTKGKLFTVEPIADAAGTSIVGFTCIDVSKRGGQCIVVCSKR